MCLLNSYGLVELDISKNKEINKKETVEIKKLKEQIAVHILQRVRFPVLTPYGPPPHPMGLHLRQKRTASLFTRVCRCFCSF